MRSGAGIVTAYRLTWLVMLAIVVAITLWLALGRRVAPVAPEDVKPSIAKPEALTQEYQEEPFADLIVNMSELELSLSSSDGKMKLRLWATRAEKNETGYAIEDGVLQFAIEERSNLMLHVQDATFTTATDTVELSGSLVGHVMSGTDEENQEPDQYFEATKLTWKLDGTTTDTGEIVWYVYADKVVYRAPKIDVSGERMILELPSGKVRFEGQVEAGV
jgi:hypothetical protein